MVCGTISYGKKSALGLLESNLNAQDYIHNALAPVAPRSLEDPVFQQDSGRPHTAAVTCQLDRSVDVSPIEHQWYVIGRRLGQLSGIIMDIQRLRQEVKVVWNSSFQEDNDHLLPQRN